MKIDFQPDAVILANGQFPTHSIPLSVLEQAHYLCCCDGAVNNLRRKPDAIVGDGDSLAPDFKQNYGDIIHIIDEQEYNDLTKATQFCMQKGFKKMAYIGATGKREDHTMGNISLMVYYTRELRLDVTLLSDHGYFTVHKGYCELQTFERQQVSIFNINCSELSGEGLKWEPYAYQSLWQGTLNEALSTKTRLHGDGYFMVFRTYDAK